MTLLRAAPPPVPNVIEPRARLLRRLADAREARLVVVAAPAGYGKTALLETWAAADRRPFRWVTVDRHHAELDRACEELARSVDALKATTGTAVLVVDDADALDAAIAAQALDAAERELPAGVAVVLSGRAAPPPAVGRLRSAWPVLELDAEDLAMTRGEATAMLRAAGVRLDAATLDALLERTEGWPSGLRLAAVAIHAQGGVNKAGADLGGGDRVIADYVRDELLGDLSPQDVAFLTGTSVLSSLSAPVCDAVLDRQDSGKVLFDLGRSTAPVRPTDRTEEHFHLNTLVAEALRAELHRTDPTFERQLHRRASAFFAAHGDTVSAIDHAIAGEDLDRAAELLWHVAPTELFDGRGDALDDWLERIGDGRVARRPALALSAALRALARGDRDLVERWAAAAQRQIWHAPVEWRAGLGAILALLRATVETGKAGALRDRAGEAAALTPRDSPWLPLCFLLRGIGHALTGDLDMARDDLDEGARCGAVNVPGVEALCLAQLGLVALQEGDAEEGAALADRARARIDHRRLDDLAIRGFVCAVAAFARACRGRVEEARADLDEARRVLRDLEGFAPWYDAQTRLALARAQLRLSDVAAARALIAEAERFAARVPDAIRLRAWIDDAHGRAGMFAVAALADPGSLTTAELRVLRFLPSHLSFREIAERLHVSANTVKTQAHAVYRKLDTSSRSAAVTRARSLGLLDA